MTQAISSLQCLSMYISIHPSFNTLLPAKWIALKVQSNDILCMWLFTGITDNLPDFDNKNIVFRNLSKIFRGNGLDVYTSTELVPAERLTESSLFSSTLVTTNKTWRDNIGDNRNFSTLPNFIYRKRCQTEDDWGTVVLNCTNDDIINERVAVIGFLINWIKAYIHIRRECIYTKEWLKRIHHHISHEKINQIICP